MLSVNLHVEPLKKPSPKRKEKTSLFFEILLGAFVFAASVGITLLLVEIDRTNPNNPARLRHEVDILKRRLERLEKK
jgi:hypothetical protein